MRQRDGAASAIVSVRGDRAGRAAVRAAAFLLLAVVLVLGSPRAGRAASAQDLIDGFLGSLPRCDLLEFSADGYLNELAASYPVLRPADIAQIGGFTTVEFPRTYVPWPSRDLRHGEYLQTRWPVNPAFRQQLADLGQAMQAAGVGQIATRDLVAAAESRLEAALRAGQPDCYKISHMDGMGDQGTVDVVTLPPEAQRQIDSLFATPDDGRFSRRERSMLDAGVIDLDEARELHALRAATMLFEQNTVLRYDIGGYGGNADFFGAVRTTCRNEMQTYYFFLRRLQRRGLLRHFAYEETWAYRPNDIPVDGHDGTILRSRRTGELFVVDSWIHDGGQPANILLLADWLAKDDD